MKDLFEISFSVKVSASPLAKGLTEPVTKILSKSIPYLERIAEAFVKDMEKENEQKEEK